MKAEHEDHVGHDRLVSPRRIPPASAGAGIEGQGQEVAGDRKQEGGRKDEEKGEGQDGGRKEGEGQDSGRKEGAGEEVRDNPLTVALSRTVRTVGGNDDPLTATLSRTVEAVGGELCEIGGEGEQRVETEPVDQHPDKGLVSGSSGDGLSHEVAMEESGERRKSRGRRRGKDTDYTTDTSVCLKGRERRA